MATDTVPRGSPDQNPARAARGGRVIEYQQYIDAQLGKTRRRVKWVDLWTSLTLLAAGVVAYLLLSAVVDHWIVPGGLGTTGRWLLLVGLLVGVAVHLLGVVAPFLLRKVNPVYAAAAIEQGGPMKNTLINFLLLRKESTAVPGDVLEAMKEQAAVRLSTVSSDAPVDRTGLLRWGYVLAAVLVGALGYAMVAPKDSFRSIRRVLSPWAELSAPTRVRIETVEPGDAQRRRDDVVTVSLRAAGIRATDAVTLFYSATGNPADDLPLPMQSDEGRYLWKTVLPPGSEGLKQDLFYYIQAGDAATPHYRLKVLATPVINVREVRFDYPSYTGLPPRTIERQGDLKALEGTRVTLTAETNQPIRAAHVAFDKARNKDVELRVDGLTAVGGFDLALLKDRTTPAHTSYVLRFANSDGEENPKPTEYKIEVTADQPPEVRVVEPNTPVEKELSLPLGGLLRVTAAARDPDFQLAELTVVLRKAGSLLREERLLSEPRYGEFSNTLVLNAERYNLRVGDKFTFRIRAGDNKVPQPNIAETKDYTVVVTPPTGGQQPPPDQRGNPPQNPPQQNPNLNQQPQQPGEGKPGEAKNGGENGQPQPGEQPNGGQPKGGQPNDGQPQNGNNPQNGAQQPQGNQPSGQNPTGGNPQTGNDQQPGEQPPEQPRGNSRDTGSKNEPQTKEGQQPQQQPIDPNVDPGKAFDELKKHFEEQDRQRDQSNPSKSNDKPQPPQMKTGDLRKQEPKEDDPNDDREANGSKQRSGEKQKGSSKQQGENEQANNSQTGEAKKSGRQQDGGAQQKDGDQPNDGGQKNSEQPSGGAGQAGAAQPQKGPDGGQPGDEQKAGGSQGTGRSQSDAPSGNQQGTGGPKNQPSQKSGDQNAQPGGEAGKPSDDNKSGNAERRPGENSGGREQKQPGEGAAPSPTGSQPQSGANSQQGERQPGDNQAGKPDGNQSGEKPQSGNEQRPGGQPNAAQPGVNRESSPASSGSGTQSGGDPPKPEGQNPRAGEKPTEQPNGKPSVNEGNPQGSQKNPGRDGQAPGGEGSPKQEIAKPRNQTSGQEAAGKSESSKEEGKSPSQSKTESDAQGEGGDRSAKKGEAGGGQKSEQSGTGAAGKSQAGEQGGGVAGQEGDAATSNQGGDKVRSGDPSQGKPSQQQGSGTQSQNSGEKSGGKNASPAGESSSGNPNGPPQNSNQPAGNEPGGSQRGLPSANDGTPPSNGKQNPVGGGNVPDGTAGGDDRTPRNANTAAAPADPANLDYAQKVTDLTLERLKQQLDKGQVDPELLKRFKSREALEEFARRWDAMRRSAKEPGPSGDAARKQFQENLKSLGLQPRTTSQQASDGVGDDFRALRGGKRSEPPAKYADQYRAYTTGVGQAEK